MSTGIDAFSFDWKFDNNWIVPPVRLISRVISHLIACKATGVLVAQKWTSSPFWSCIVNNDGTFKGVVKECVEFKEPSRFYVRGSQRNNVFHEKNVVFNIVVLRLDMQENCEAILLFLRIYYVIILCILMRYVILCFRCALSCICIFIELRVFCALLLCASGRYV